MNDDSDFISEADLPQSLRDAENHLRSINRPVETETVPDLETTKTGLSGEVWEIVKRVRRRRGVAC